MDKQREMVEAFKADLPEILAGNDPVPEVCTRCGMTFVPTGRGSHCEKTVCVDCGRWFGHGSPKYNSGFIRCYKL